MPGKEEQRLRQVIEDLRQELEQVASEDPAKRERLERLRSSIDARLEGPVAADHQQELIEELRDEAVEFEVEHPDVSATLRGFLNMLSNIGI